MSRVTQPIHTKNATAMEVALLHKRLGDAYLAISGTSEIGLSSAGIQFCIRTKEALTRQGYRLEDRFLQTAKMYETSRSPVPFANLTEPDSWVNWLIKMTKDKKHV